MPVVGAALLAQGLSWDKFLHTHLPPTSCLSFPFLQAAAAQLFQTHISTILETENGLGCETLCFVHVPCGNCSFKTICRSYLARFNLLVTSKGVNFYISYDIPTMIAEATVRPATLFLIFMHFYHFLNIEVTFHSASDHCETLISYSLFWLLDYMTSRGFIEPKLLFLLPSSEKSFKYFISLFLYT